MVGPWIAAACSLWVAWIVVLPFLRNASETRGDAAGHFALAQLFRDTCWPAWRSFQPDFFLGFMQGEFYPPLFHYLVATLGKCWSLVAVYRGILALAMLATPLAAYRCARALGFHATRAAWFVVATTAILFTSPNLLQAERLPGGTFHSTSVIGLAANGFALPLWFEAIGAIVLALRRRSAVSIVIASVLSAAVVLSHFVCAVAELAFAGVLVAVFARTQAIRTFATAVAIASGTFVLSAFFVVPFFVDRAVSPLATIPAGHVPLTYVLAALALLSITHERVNRCRSACAAVLFVVSIVIAQWVGTASGFAAHLDRFHPFVQIVALLPICRALPRRLPLSITGAIAGAVAIALSFAQAREFARWEPPGDMRAPALASSARTLIVGDAMQLPGPHWISNAWPASTRSASALGLFVESSPVAPYLFQISRILVPSALSWGVDLGEGFEAFQERLLRAPEVETAQRLRAALRRLGIDHLLTEQSPLDGEVGRESMTSMGSVVAARRSGEFTLYRLDSESQSGRATIARGPLVACESAETERYRTLARDWLFASRDDEPLPIVAAGAFAAADPEAVRGAVVRCDVIDDRHPIWRLSIDANEAIPVVLALGFHPRLRARGDGIDLPVFRAGPGLAMVIARGEIEVDLGTRSLETIFDRISIVGWMLLLLFGYGGVSRKYRQVRLRFRSKGSLRTSD